MNFRHTNYPRESEYPKLVRDKIPEIIKEQGGESSFRVIQAEGEFFEYLVRKLQEEAEELLHSGKEGNFEEEFADIFEIISALSTLKGTTVENITSVQEEKRTKRGGFKKRIVMLGPSKSKSEQKKSHGRR